MQRKFLRSVGGARRRPAPRRSRSSPRSAAFEDVSDRVSALGGADAYPAGVWQTTQVKGQEGTWAVP